MKLFWQNDFGTKSQKEVKLTAKLHQKVKHHNILNSQVQLYFQKHIATYKFVSILLAHYTCSFIN
jgi:hypothetical protein